MTGVPQGAHELFGWGGTPVKVVAAGYTVACVLATIAIIDDVSMWWPPVVAAAICSAAAWLLVLPNGDPLPLRYTIAISSSGAAASAALFAVAPVPPVNPLQLWPGALCAVLFAFLGVRGRPGFAWLGLGLMVSTSVVWGVVTKLGALYGFSYMVVHIAPVLVCTLFAVTIRPLANTIYELRAQSTQRVAAESAAAAVLEERDAQLDRLDVLARPLLERIGSGRELDADERLACELLEARLRDGLRAPALQDPAVVAAARAARSRGVEVILLDDRGMDAAASPVRQRLLAAVVSELDALGDGATVTVRILPPRRPVMATVLVGSGDETRRLEFDHAGRIVDRAAER